MRKLRATAVRCRYVGRFVARILDVGQSKTPVDGDCPSCVFHGTQTLFIPKVPAAPEIVSRLRSAFPARTSCGIRIFAPGADPPEDSRSQRATSETDNKLADLSAR